MMRSIFDHHLGRFKSRLQSPESTKRFCLIDVGVVDGQAQLDSFFCISIAAMNQ